MPDRRYLVSLAISVAVVVAALGGIVSLTYSLGWGGAVGSLAILGGFLGWFYWGPRPDLRPTDRGGEHGRPGNDA
ncbi:MAG TPA: hypothetical protein VLM91_08775 [Candidatus Methylomirabilis sp.]|nr:hypothetical protein [Candidatus Methylomirabilis sp.]